MSMVERTRRLNIASRFADRLLGSGITLETVEAVSDQQLIAIRAILQPDPAPQSSESGN